MFGELLRENWMRKKVDWVKWGVRAGLAGLGTAFLSTDGCSAETRLERITRLRKLIE